MFFFEILIPKVKSVANGIIYRPPNANGIIYRPPNANDFLNTISNDFQNKTNEIYLLGDFNINLLQNAKIILKENQLCELKNSISVLVKKCLILLPNIFIDSDF